MVNILGIISRNVNQPVGGTDFNNSKRQAEGARLGYNISFNSYEVSYIIEHEHPDSNKDGFSNVIVLNTGIKIYTQTPMSDLHILIHNDRWGIIEPKPLPDTLTIKDQI